MANVLDLGGKINELPLNFINYKSLQQSNAGFLRTDTWDFEFTQMAPATYFPGNDFLKTRLIGCQVSMEDGAIGSIAADIRGYHIEQPVGTGSHDGTFTLELQDFEDQSLQLWLWDWYTKIRDTKTNFSFSKADLMSNAQFIVYSGQRVPIRKYTMLGCYPQSVGDGIDFNGSSDDAADAGKISVSFKCENVTMDLLNH